jgi:quinol-cytochrome oxidoreductase complex cytochrome b subunit
MNQPESELKSGIISSLVDQAMARAGISATDSPLTTANTFALMHDALVRDGEIPAVVNPAAPQPPRTGMFTVGAASFAAIALAVSLVVLFPPHLGEAFDVFATPVHIVPEWYLLPAFGVVLAAPTKLLGLGVMAGVLLILFALPVLPKLEKYVPKGPLVFRTLFVLLHLGVAAVGFSALKG